MTNSSKTIHVVGGGLAGSEAAWQAAHMGAKVVLHEMRPVRETDAHQTDGLAELVCSNSFRSDDHEYNAVGLLHEEMRRCNSIIMQAGDKNKLPAGGALAVDRDAFSADVTATLEAHPNIEIDRSEVAGLPPKDWDNVILATGPLTSPALAEGISRSPTQIRSLSLMLSRRSSIKNRSIWTLSGRNHVMTKLDRAAPARII